MKYSYLQEDGKKSDLISSVENGAFRTDYGYENKRNLKTKVRNSQNSVSIISQYDYKYDELGRRTSVVNTGNAFAQSAFNKYGYNDRSELTASERFLGTDPPTPVDPEKRLYAYDPIGNRRTATEDTAVTSYTSNNLNQYTALSGAKAATPLHDDDGNVTDYKNLKYSWNAENQMIAAEPKNPSEGDKKTEYLYDYMGRRARKRIFVYSSGAWNQTTEKLFVYDGWNLIKEITKTGGTPSDKYYVWGLDLSQSFQGAGGIGGLVCAVHAGEVRHYFFDGNGNVGQVVNDIGNIVARYEYDPFGNIVNGVSQNDDNPFRFSTKYFDAETGLYYYGFRYYSAELGRWWSRDPLEEHGGLNRYVFVTNNPINKADLLGREGLDWVDAFPATFPPPYEPQAAEKDDERVWNIIKKYASGAALRAKKELKSRSKGLYAVGLQGGIGALPGVGGVFLGVNPMFFPETCEMAVYWYINGLWKPQEWGKAESFEDWKSRLVGIGTRILQAGSVGASVGIGWELVIAKPHGGGEHNAESWLGWFYAGFGSRGSVFYSSGKQGWIGGTISMPGSLSAGVGGYVATYYEYFNKCAGGRCYKKLEEDGCACTYLRYVALVNPVEAANVLKAVFDF